MLITKYGGMGSSDYSEQFIYHGIWIGTVKFLCFL